MVFPIIADRTLRSRRLSTRSELTKNPRIFVHALMSGGYSCGFHPYGLDVAGFSLVVRRRVLGTGTYTPLAPHTARMEPQVADEVIRSSLDALDEAFFRMNAVRDASGGIVDFEYEFCNRAALAVLGLRREEVLGRRLLNLFPSHRANGLFEVFTSVTETGEPVRLEFSFAEGDVVGEFEVVVSRVGDGYVLAGHDIGDRKRLERELVALKDQLQEALSSRIAIEQAKGYVAAQLRMDPETAFLAIRRYARGHDLRIGVVARAIVTGELVLGES